MTSPRLPPLTLRPSGASTADAASSSQTGALSGSTAASGHKHPLPPPPAPSAIRPRLHVDAPQAVPTTYHQAPLQRQAQAVAAPLRSFGMDWNALNKRQREALFRAMAVQPPHPPGTTEASRREEQLHAVLFSIQLEHDMARLYSQGQRLRQIIAPAMLTACVQEVHYGGVTINGPHLDEAGRRRFYLERQCGHACAQHAVNAMVGGPLLSLTHFAQWEALAQQGSQSDMEKIAADMQALGVHSESVQGALHNLEIPTHKYASRPIANAQGMLALDPRQARLLDNLPTDRLLLQADKYEGNSKASHYVAFRRDHDQWVLLDSLEDEPQYGRKPSDYLLRDEGHRSFTAIWPQHILREESPDFDIEGRICEPMGTAHEAGGGQDNQSFAPPAQVQAVDAIQEAHGTDADQGSKQTTDRPPYSFTKANDQWRYSKRAKEFELLRQALGNTRGKQVSGGAILQLLSQACDKAKPEDRQLIAELNEEKIKGHIFEFKVKIDDSMDVVQVWRGVYDNGHINLRRAPKKDDNKAYTDLLTEMKIAAHMSSLHRRSKQDTPYSAKDAWYHWNHKERAEEFEPLRQAWQEATNNSAKQASGPAFLRHLSAECDKAEEGGKLIEHLGKHGEILEFKVQTHEGAMPQRIWRGVDGKGHIHLRLTPDEGNKEAHRKLLDEMKKSMQKINSSLRIEQLPGQFVYPYVDAQNHWRHPKLRAKEFEPLRQASEKAMGKEISGPVFLQLLSQACDKAKPEDCKLIKDLDEKTFKGRIFEFKVQMHREMEAAHVWREVGDNGYIDLRLAPENSDRADQLLTEMLQSMRASGIRRNKRPTLGRFHFTLNVHRHWRGQRATELEPLRQVWQEAMKKSGKQASGPAFLKHLLTECSKASDKAELRYDLGEHAKIYEFEVQTHPEGREERFWCWIDGADCITNLRKAPEKGDADAYEKLKAEMTAAARVVSSRLGGCANDHIDVANIVKPEPATLAAAFPAPVAGVEAIRLNTVQIHHVPTITYAMIDLTVPDGSTQTVFTVRHPDEAIVSTGKQTYDPTLNKVFPIRAPAHPDQVHPDYADPDDPSRCAAQVALKGIHFYKGGASLSEQTLWQRAKTNFKNDFPYQSKKLFIEALKRSCEEELKATMQGRQPPSSRAVRIDLITEENQCDSPEEFAALHNQYGGFLTDYASSNQPSLRNARIVCLFAGSRLVSEEDSRQYLDQFGAEFGWKALQDYAANAQQYGKQGQLAWAPYGGGNMGQYLNSSFKPGNEDELQVDADKTNAFLCPVIVELTDRHGQARKESMLMVIQDRPIAQGKQIKLNYGNDYVLDVKKSESQMPSHSLKQEIPEGQAEAGGSMSALDK